MQTYRVKVTLEWNGRQENYNFAIIPRAGDFIEINMGYFEVTKTVLYYFSDRDFRDYHGLVAQVYVKEAKRL